METTTNETKTIITFKQEQIILKYGDSEKPVLAHVAYQDGESTGLAYCTHCSIDGDLYYTLTHIATGRAVNGKCTSTEVDAMKWVEGLLAIAKWTEKTPVVTAEPMKLLGWAALGVWSSIEE